MRDLKKTLFLRFSFCQCFNSGSGAVTTPCGHTLNKDPRHTLTTRIPRARIARALPTFALRCEVGTFVIRRALSIRTTTFAFIDLTTITFALREETQT